MSVALTADQGTVRVITMNRPEARNALNSNLIEGLFAALTDADADADADGDIRAAVLTGADPALCAGVDLAAPGHGLLRDVPVA